METVQRQDRQSRIRVRGDPGTAGLGTDRILDQQKISQSSTNLHKWAFGQILANEGVSKNSESMQFSLRYGKLHMLI